MQIPRTSTTVCPLHWAAHNGHAETCKLLLEHDADIIEPLLTKFGLKEKDNLFEVIWNTL